jgi:hypothetical protein
MLSVAKHLYEIALICGEMLHFVQHDNGFAMSHQSNCVTPNSISTRVVNWPLWDDPISASRSSQASLIVYDPRRNAISPHQKLLNRRAAQLVILPELPLQLFSDLTQMRRRTRQPIQASHHAASTRIDLENRSSFGCCFRMVEIDLIDISNDP